MSTTSSGMPCGGTFCVSIAPRAPRVGVILGSGLGAFADQLDGATVFMGVPTYYTRLLAHPDFNRECCSTIRLFVSGSAPLLA